MELNFDWDSIKSKENIGKHGVSFGEAATVFHDPLSVFIPDTVHSDNEERLLLLGLSEHRRLLVVSHTERENIIRLISARLATGNEKRNYEEEL